MQVHHHSKVNLSSYSVRTPENFFSSIRYIYINASAAGRSQHIYKYVIYHIRYHRPPLFHSVGFMYLFVCLYYRVFYIHIIYIYIFVFYQTAPANEVDRRPSKKTGKYQDADDADSKKYDPTGEDQQQSSRAAAAAAAAGKCSR